MTKTEQAAADLATYLKLCGINSIADQINALRRHYGVSWLQMLQRSHLADDLSAMDVANAVNLLLSRLECAEEVQP